MHRFVQVYSYSLEDMSLGEAVEENYNHFMEKFGYPPEEVYVNESEVQEDDEFPECIDVLYVQGDEYPSAFHIAFPVVIKRHPVVMEKERTPWTTC